MVLNFQPSVKKTVAVKIFLSDIQQHSLNSSISELLELSKQPKHLLYAYKEIRQEVSFLSNLEHHNLTKLLGVRTSPYMCLVLELAPKKSLGTVLREYKSCSIVLEPLTLKNTALQVCAYSGCTCAISPPPSDPARLLKVWSTSTLTRLYTWT